jgi:PhnB protein
MYRSPPDKICALCDLHIDPLCKVHLGILDPVRTLSLAPCFIEIADQSDGLDPAGRECSSGSPPMFGPGIRVFAKRGRLGLRICMESTAKPRRSTHADSGGETVLRCTPFLHFDGNCAQAMSFYRDCFGGKLALTKLGDTAMKAQFPREKHGRIINAHLQSGAFELSGTDWMASPALEPVRGNMSAVFVTGDTAELKPVFGQLSVGANREHFQDLHEMPFGIYGQFYDKYGVQWIFRGGS